MRYPQRIDPLRYNKLLDALEDENKQKNADTDAFLVGFNYAAWRGNWRLASIARNTLGEEFAGVLGQGNYLFFKSKCEKLGLTTEQLTPSCS